MSGSNGSANGHARRATVLGTVRPPDFDKVLSVLGDRERSLIRRRQESIDLLSPYGDVYDRFGDRDLMPSWLGGFGYGWPHERTGRLQPAPAGMLSEQELRGAIVFSRWLCERNQLAVGFLGHVTNFTYGDGAEWEVSLRGNRKGAVSTGVVDADADGEPDSDPAVDRCQAFLEEWRRAAGWGEGADRFEVADLDGCDRTPKSDRQAEAGKRGARDGNALIRFFRGGDDGLPMVRFIEPELIRTPPSQPRTVPWYDGEIVWAWGVAVDCEDAETIVAYGVAEKDGPGTVEVVPAGRIAHLKLNVDGTVAMGVPDFFCVQDGLETARKLLRNIGEVGVELAAITLLTEHAEGTTQTQVAGMIEANKDYSAPRIVPFAGVQYKATRLVDPGQEVHVGFGQKVSAGPVQNADPFIGIVQAILRSAGMRWGCPEYFSGDASNANFASTQVAGGPFERAMKRRQKDVTAFEQAVAMRVLAFGVAAGRLSRDEVDRVTVAVRFPSVAIANKLEDTQRRNVLNAAGVLSPQTWAAEEELDPGVELANIRAHAAQTAPPPVPVPGAPPAVLPVGESVTSGVLAVWVAESLASVEEAVGYVEGQHPRGRDGRFIKKSAIDDARAAYKRGDKGPAEALRAIVKPEDRALLDSHLASDAHAGDAKAFHPGAQKAGHLRDLGWKAGNELVDHVGKVLDHVTEHGALTPEQRRDLVVKVAAFVRSKRIPELQNVLRSMNVPHAEFVGKGKEELQKLIADRVKAAVFDAEVNHHVRAGAGDPDRQLVHAESVAVESADPPPDDAPKLPRPGQGHPLDPLGAEILAALKSWRPDGDVAEAHGAPPRPGLVFDEGSHRWVRPDEATGPTHAGAAGGDLAAHSHPAVIHAAKAVAAKVGELAVNLNAWCVKNGVTPDAVIGTAQDWAVYYATEHADALIHATGVDHQTAVAIFAHVAAHAVGLMKRKLAG